MSAGFAFDFAKLTVAMHGCDVETTILVYLLDHLLDTHDDVFGPALVRKFVLLTVVNLAETLYHLKFNLVSLG